MRARLAHVWLLLRWLPVWLTDAGWRAQLRAMRRFCRQLPEQLRGPLPEALAALTPSLSPTRVSSPVEAALRQTADLASLLERHSPLGMCLRRSLTRYHYLRRAGVPVRLVFGARFVNGQSQRDITGHAWLTLDEAVYYESAENHVGFTPIYTYPPPTDA